MTHIPITVGAHNNIVMLTACQTRAERGKLMIMQEYGPVQKRKGILSVLRLSPPTTQTVEPKPQETLASSRLRAFQDGALESNIGLNLETRGHGCFFLPFLGTDIIDSRTSQISSTIQLQRKAWPSNAAMRLTMPSLSPTSSFLFLFMVSERLGKTYV